MASATVADAMSVRRSAQEASGNLGAGKEVGSAPTWVTWMWAVTATMVAAATAIRATGIAGRTRTSRIMAATAKASRTGANWGAWTHAATARPATTTTCSPSAGTPRAAGICCRPMMTAMPRVKPSMTGSGM